MEPGRETKRLEGILFGRETLHPNVPPATEMAGRASAVKGRSVARLAEDQAVALEGVKDDIVGLAGALTGIDVSGHVVAVGVEETAHARRPTDRQR
jgi:hypothetical protein